MRSEKSQTHTFSFVGATSNHSHLSTSFVTTFIFWGQLDYQLIRSPQVQVLNLKKYNHKKWFKRQKSMSDLTYKHEFTSLIGFSLKRKLCPRKHEKSFKLTTDKPSCISVKYVPQFYFNIKYRNKKINIKFYCSKCGKSVSALDFYFRRKNITEMSKKGP